MTIKRGFQVALIVVGLGILYLLANRGEVTAQATIREDRYTIVKGDTLWGISQRANLTLDELVLLNQLDVNAYIHPGQTLVIKPVDVAETTKVEANDRTTLGMTQAQYEALEMIVQQEAGFNRQSVEWVMTTILNRVEATGFPDDIWSVVTQAHQFEAYGAGHYLRHTGNITEDTRLGMMDAINKESRAHTHLFFWESTYASQNGRTGTNVGGNTYFDW